MALQANACQTLKTSKASFFEMAFDLDIAVA
jgi:hypothetical protein